MRTFPMRLLLSAVIVAAFAVTSVGANAGSSTVSKVGPLKLCTYSTGDANEGSQTLIVKVVAVGGRGVKGTVRFVAASKGLDRTVPFTLKKGGIGLVALPITPPVAVTLTTTLRLKPIRTRTDHVNVKVTDPNVPTPRGCVAR